jgi:hypothetical protein
MEPPWSLAGAARAGLALLGWVAVVTWLTWPLASVATTHVPWRGPDALYSMWALAWQSHALATDPARYFDANIYHPAPGALAYGPTGTGALALFGPVFAVSHNPALALNVLFIGGSALTAWTIGLVAARWTRSAAAGAVAGSTYLAAPWVLYEWVPACPHFAMLMWVPLIMDRASRPSLRLRDALVLAVMVALQAAVEVVYIAPAVFIPLALLMVVRLAHRSTRVSGLHLGAALLAAMIALSPLLSAHAAARRADPELTLQTMWRSSAVPAASASLPTPPVPWTLFGWWKHVGNSLTPPPPMAVPPLAFGLIGCGILSRFMRRRRGIDEPGVRAWRHAALWTVTAIVLALPTRVLLWGSPTIVPNLLWLRQVFPVIGFMRVPSRLGVVGLVGLSLLAGLAFGEIVRRALHRWQARPWTRVVDGALAGVIALATFDQPRSGWGYPLGFVVNKPRQTYAVYPLGGKIPYAAVLRANRGPLLEIGRGVFADPIVRGKLESRTMIRSIRHWRPLLNGYSSYWPKQYERFMSLASQLPEDLGALATLREETGVELILVWLYEMQPLKRVAWKRVASEALVSSRGDATLVLVGNGEQGAILFRVTAKR